MKLFETIKKAVLFFYYALLLSCIFGLLCFPKGEDKALCFLCLLGILTVFGGFAHGYRSKRQEKTAHFNPANNLPTLDICENVDVGGNVIGTKDSESSMPMGSFEGKSGNP